MVSKKKNGIFALEKPNAIALELSRKWLILGIIALAFAGLFAVLLVAARTPGMQDIMPWRDFFHTALVVHVDLSVLVWLYSFACVIWIYAANSTSLNYKFQFYISAAGVAAIAISPFTGEGNPLMNNYIPVLQNNVFFIGLSLFITGVIVQLVFSTIALVKNFQKNILTPQRIAIMFSAFIAIIAEICFYLSQTQLTSPGVGELYNPQDFYEKLFWGGGHILQFVYTTLMVVAWLWMAEVIGLKTLPNKKVLTPLYVITLAIVLVSPYIYFSADITSFEHIDFFTQQMRFGGGIVALVVGGYIAFGLVKRNFDKSNIAIKNTLIFSVLLFGAGGILGFLIHGSNVVIPAHYHGSIVGVTLAFMGLTYYLLPQMGYRKTDGNMARWQPILYGGGQLLHIIGLAWSGGYGALRKTPGAVQSAEGQTAMGLMGLGGLLSVIGGLLFVIVAYKSISSSHHKR